MRSEKLLTRTGCALLVIDVQERLLAKIAGRERIVANTVRLIEAAKLLGIPLHAVEQYPHGLGPTVPELACRLPPPIQKLSFSAGQVPELTDQLVSSGIRVVVLAGIEAHVCVLQTAFDLQARGLAVFVAADATGSRKEADWRTAIERMARSGITIGSTESFIFEWIETAAIGNFKAISRLVVATDDELLGSTRGVAEGESE
jgi:nicotinamidase-related amidase